MIITSRKKLGELMKHLGLPMIAAEVGTASGIFATELLSMGIEKLYLVDLWEQMPFIQGCASWEQGWHDKNYEEVQKRFSNDERAIILKGFSHKMAKLIDDESLGAVYLDAAHDKNSARADLDIWTPKVVKGGIVAGHDYLNPDYGVKDAVVEFTSDEHMIHILEEDEGIFNAGFYFIKK